MAADDFFSRWSKKKTDDVGAPLSDAIAVTDLTEHPLSINDAALRSEQDAVRSLPTHDDVANLTHDSDFSSFMAKGVDESVKLSAMKKLFTNPHFNVMDGLDIYIGDYNTFEPITPEILASLNHAKALLDPSSQFETSVMQLVQNIEENVEDSVDLAAETELLPEQSETHSVLADNDKREDADEQIISVSNDAPETPDVDPR